MATNYNKRWFKNGYVVPVWASILTDEKWYAGYTTDPPPSEVPGNLSKRFVCVEYPDATMHITSTMWRPRDPNNASAKHPDDEVNLN